MQAGAAGVSQVRPAESRQLDRDLRKLVGAAAVRFQKLWSRYQMLVIESYFFKIKDNKLDPVVSVEELKKLNEAIESKSLIKRIAGFVKNFGSFVKVARSMLPRVLPLYLPGNIESYFKKMNAGYMRIGVLKVMPFEQTAGYRGSYGFIPLVNVSGLTYGPN